MERNLLKKIVYLVGISLTFVILFNVSLDHWGVWYDEWSGYNASEYVSDGICNIGVVTIHGSIIAYENEYGSYEGDPVTTSPEDVTATLKRITNDSYIKGVLVKVNSLGGSPAGADAISEMLKSYTLPTVAYIGDYGTSAGYLIATGAGSIIASPFSDIGSIGVTMSYLENIRQNDFDGIDYVELTSAPYKDYMNPNRPLSDEERGLLQRDLTIFHSAFVQRVAENRELDQNYVQTIADGSSMPASLALEANLIDQIGGMEKVREYLGSQLNIPKEEVIICE